MADPPSELSSIGFEAFANYSSDSLDVISDLDRNSDRGGAIQNNFDPLGDSDDIILDSDRGRCNLDSDCECNRRSSEEGDSETQSANTTISDHNETQAPRFRRLRFLARYFQKKKLPNGTIWTTCRRCREIIKAREAKRLVKHLENCKFLTEEERRVTVEKMDAHQRMKKVQPSLNEDWGIVMIANGFSFASTESKEFRWFIRKHIPTWPIASRHRFSAQIIPKQAEIVQRKFLEKMRDRGGCNITVAFDHWTDANNRNLLAVILCFGEEGYRYFLAAEDVSQEGHFTDVIVEKLKKCLTGIAPQMINAIISDSASSCKKAREDIVTVENFYHVIQHRCLAHHINRIGDKIIKDPCMASSIKSASHLASLVTNNSRLRSIIRASGKTQVKTSGSRWYGTVEMINSLIDKRSVIVEEISRCKNNEDRKLVADDIFWSNLRRSLCVLKPFADCIGILERNDASLGRAVREILSIGKLLFKLDWTDPFVLSSVSAYLEYMSLKKLGDELGLLIAAYLLDAHNLANYLEEEGIDLALEAISNIALASGYCLDFVRDSLAPAFSEFVIKIESFKSDQEQSAVAWWTSRRDRGALADIAIRLANLKASSAGIERMFSTLKHIQGHQKFGLALDSLTNIGRVKIDLQNRKSRMRSDRRGVEQALGDRGGIATLEFSPRPELLSPRSLCAYREFTRYFKYSIVHRSRGDETDSQRPQTQENTITAIVCQSRDQRAKRRTAAEALLSLENIMPR